MLARIRKSMEEKDQGFTLIELLVVMIIIGILAAIAIPVFLNQKKKAAETSAKSDATNISKELSAFLVDASPTTVAITNGGPGPVDATLDATYAAFPAESATVKVGKDNTVTVAYTNATTWCVTAQNSLAGTSAWSAGPNGLKKGATC